MSKESPINVLMIDDDNDYASSFKNQAAKHQVIITNITNLEDGFKELKKGQKKYSAIILDGKAPMNSSQPAGTEKENFVQEAISKIKAIEASSDKLIPFCVHTAWYVQLKESLEGRAKVFDKKKTSVDEEVMKDLFQYLKSEVKNLPDQRIRKEFADVFEFSDAYFDEEDKGVLLELLGVEKPKDEIQIINSLNLMRRLEESVYDILCEEYLGMDPIDFGKDSQSRTRGIIKHFKDNFNVPTHIDSFATSIYKVTSSYTVHKPAKSSVQSTYTPNIYTAKTIKNALLEIIVWAKDLIDSK